MPREPAAATGSGKEVEKREGRSVGALYTLRRDKSGKLDGSLNKRVYATFESYRALFEWPQDEAKKRGYGTKKFTKVLFLDDGA